MRTMLAVLSMLAIAACNDDSSEPASPPGAYEPREGDGELVRGAVFLDAAGLLIMEMHPPQVRLDLRGTLPTPCHQLRAVVSAPDARRVIGVEVYSLVDPKVVCIQVLQAFEAKIDIPTPPPGRYQVAVNGRVIGEFSY